MKKTFVATAVGIALGGTSLQSSAALTSSAVLDFTTGTPETVSCTLGTVPPCTNTAFNVTDMAGSYFSMDTNGNGSVEITEKNSLTALNGVHIGSTQLASGDHSGPINGSENPNIDQPWMFFGNTGMHMTTSPVTVISDFGSTKTLDFSGWNVIWNNVGPINMGNIATITCDSASCSNSSSFSLDLVAHVPSAGITSVGYTLHLEGHVSAVPVPAAAWLFGSGLLGLAATARRRKQRT